MSARRGAALVEFALAWPVFLLGVLALTQVSLWSVEAYAARAAALAGARAGASAAGSPAAAQASALAVLTPFLAGVRPEGWCPGGQGSAPKVWVCGRASGPRVEVVVGGSAPTLVPLLPAAVTGLPLAADAVLPKEAFTR